MHAFMRAGLIGAGLALASISFSAVAKAAVTIVNGSDDIFAAGLTSVPASPGGGGTLPSFITVTPGTTLKITATGSVMCCDTAPTPGATGPDGFATNPFGSGSVITNSIGSGVGTYSGTAFALAGVFLGTSGIGTPFTIGSSDTVLVPTGVDRLYFGLPDASGFNGPSGFYGDNSGSFTVTSGVPEPSTWAMMLIGFLGLAFTSYRAARKAGTDQTARGVVE